MLYVVALLPKIALGCVFNYLTVLTLSQYGVAPSIGLSYPLPYVALFSKLVRGRSIWLAATFWREMRSDLVA